MERLIVHWAYMCVLVIGVFCDERCSCPCDSPIPVQSEFKEKHFKRATYTTIRLPCKIKNLGTDDVIWRKGDTIISEGLHVSDPKKMRLIEDEESRDLSIYDLQLVDSGNYSCEINTDPPRRFTHTLEVLDTRITSTNQTFTIPRGETVILPCEIHDLADKPPYWAKNEYDFIIHGDGGVHWPDEPDSRLKIVQGFNLQIEKVKNYDEGIWTCRIPGLECPEESRRIVFHTLKVLKK